MPYRSVHASPTRRSSDLPFSPVEMQMLEYAVANFWDSIGISQVSAAARREKGIESGVAMMTLNDTKAGRQLVKADRKSTRLNSSHSQTSYAVFCLKKKKC